MKKMVLDHKAYEETARQAVAEGQVLLINEEHTLPLQEGTRLAMFGRMQFHYYKSGTGSGGMVNVSKVTGILDALKESGQVILDPQVLSAYEAWVKEHPFDAGVGWGNEPWCQVEMELPEELVSEAAARNDAALVIIGRTAGEDQDNKNQEGSYLLTEKEKDMLSKVRKHFERLILVLNTGNIMDMDFVEEYHPQALLYAWQGGMVGGYGTADVLLGKTCPSGRLTDTIAYKITDYPSDANFGNRDRDLYEEDIYVGYRYFETAAKERVRYPFGFGLSYTDFRTWDVSFSAGERDAEITFTVQNIGTVPGKEVVQVYVTAPEGALSKPEKVLAGFAKTRELKPGLKEQMRIAIPYESFASYDETGASGFASSYILEKGEYLFHIGRNVRETEVAGSFTLEETVCLASLSQALAPVTPFERMRFIREKDGAVHKVMEAAPLRKKNPAEKRKELLPEELPFTGDQGYRLIDVKEGRVSMDAFVAQFNDDDLSCIIRGEGMGSPKVTPGTAAAFGGVSEELAHFGIPCGCCSDGPSGMRLDSGMKAFSLPNGTLLASTFNTALVEKLYSFTGIEMVKNKIDALLGPGMNIHRHPLNGRNFEYFSEDPFVTGKMAAAMIRGLKSAGVTGTAKHFCANNQETGRSTVDSVISERALREIYLKGFEMAVREAGADSIMTTYGSVNGLWTAGSYDLNTTILRGEWGFQGIVMTDWWAKINDEGEEPRINNFAAMAKAQDDLYMVCTDASINDSDDNTLSSLKAGTLTRGELQRNAANICGFLMNTHALERMEGIQTSVEVIGETDQEITSDAEVTYYKVEDEISISLDGVDTGKDKDFVFALDLQKLGGYRVEVTAKSDLSELAQLPATLIYQSVPMAVFSFNGTGGEWKTIKRKVVFHNKYAVLRLYFAQNGLEVQKITFRFDRELERKDDVIEAYVNSND